ncbi:hypothetical protein AM571_PB00230 (plasmid) [Rhizobium etli 8C-3]|uniref:Uncharacterized protein n=1 Tax=Rhizobium etli 8C-3 TaxID=538025 RepID=A0A1L5PBL5_RHIET|nr:hypothetical protein IE4803_PB00296 [Rhizobium etli bv. phaseoli str. IE4803]APO77515.1 hypothetical protein AM571_PB00230 [Rhizobium etli 8C-3]ARM15075.1 hypothetical protein Bra5_PB00329 [Rhizobium phaseoli Brasil 5]ARO26865.1 hypothetical protein TAL182_PC00258 [Rhizobium sp. TAL182]ARQ60739.1 hypothetical protein Kim5_PA00269 [Rhizobium sp. Kim5]
MQARYDACGSKTMSLQVYAARRNVLSCGSNRRLTEDYGRKAQARHLCPSGDLACEPVRTKDYPLSRTRRCDAYGLEALPPVGTFGSWTQISTGLKRIHHFHMVHPQHRVFVDLTTRDSSLRAYLHSSAIDDSVAY